MRTNCGALLGENEPIEIPFCSSYSSLSTSRSIRLWSPVSVERSHCPRTESDLCTGQTRWLRTTTCNKSRKMGHPWRCIGVLKWIDTHDDWVHICRRWFRGDGWNLSRKAGLPVRGSPVGLAHQHFRSHITDATNSWPVGEFCYGSPVEYSQFISCEPSQTYFALFELGEFHLALRVDADAWRLRREIEGTALPILPEHKNHPFDG